jgi:hypothetical protein
MAACDNDQQYIWPHVIMILIMNERLEFKMEGKNFDTEFHPKYFIDPG